MAPLTSLHRHLWTFMLLLALHLQASASAMVTSALTKALAKPKPVVVHLYDPKPADLKEYALVDVSIACRDAGTTGILTMPELVKGFADEQEDARGSFPGPVPVLVDCGLKDGGLAENVRAATAANIADWKASGASGLGVRYYRADWPDEGALEAELARVVADADAAGLAAILLPEFGTLGEEGAEGASGLAERVGAAAALMKAAGDGAPALGCWNGSDQDLLRLRSAGLGGLIVKDACRGDIGFGSATKSPSLAAQAVGMLVKKALSKKNDAIWGGAGGVSEGKEQALDSYFDNRG